MDDQKISREGNVPERWYYVGVGILLCILGIGCLTFAPSDSSNEGMQIFMGGIMLGVGILFPFRRPVLAILLGIPIGLIVAAVRILEALSHFHT